MAINKKLIHFQTASNFEAQLAAGNILDTSICFIKDAKKIWTHGEFYDCSGDAEDINNIKPLIVDFSIGDISAYIHYGTEFNYNSSSIINALQNKQPIYIPYENEGLEGYYPAYGFIEDLIYLDVFCGSTVYILELDLSGGGIVSISEYNLYNFVAESDLADIALTGDYNDLTNKPTIPDEQVNADWNATSGKAQILNKPTIPSAVTESTVSGWGFTKNTGTITGVSVNGKSVATKNVANIPAASTGVYGVTKLNSATNSTSTYEAATPSAVKAAYDLANSYKGTVTSVKINGSTKRPIDGIVDLGTVITTHQVLKTINGQSIIGSGNITISGGGSSSGGNGAYSEVNHGTSDTTFTLTPNTFHIWDEVASLTLDLGSETSGVANEFLFQFTSGATATSLTLPDDIKWANELDIEPNMIYQVSILKGLASVLEWNNAPTLIENKATLTDSTITFQYPVASELTIKVGMGTVTMSAGEKSYQVKYPEPGMSIMNISPISDSIYYYTF